MNPYNEMDNNLRPYASGFKSEEYGIATILLYTDNSPSLAKSDNDVNYITDQATKISTLEISDFEDGENTVIPGGNIPIFKLDGENDYYGIFNNFSLLNVREDNSEIVKVQMNFGAYWNAFFFGKKPSVYAFSGVFLDTADYPYYQEFMVAYERYLSGRKCVENKFKMKIMYDGKIVEGYMLNVSTEASAQEQYTKGFTFTVLVSDEQWIRTNFISKASGINEPSWEKSFNGMSNGNRLGSLHDSGINSMSMDTTNIDHSETRFV